MVDVKELIGWSPDPKKYPYRYRVGFSDDDSSVPNSDDFMQYVQQSKIPCSIVGKGVYTRTKADAMAIFLRWA